MIYEVTIESENDLKSVSISKVSGLDHARLILRQKYPFKEWRIVNIAAVTADVQRLPQPESDA